MVHLVFIFTFGDVGRDIAVIERSAVNNQLYISDIVARVLPDAYFFIEHQTATSMFISEMRPILLVIFLFGSWKSIKSVLDLRAAANATSCAFVARPTLIWIILKDIEGKLMGWGYLGL